MTYNPYAAKPTDSKSAPTGACCQKDDGSVTLRATGTPSIASIAPAQKTKVRYDYSYPVAQPGVEFDSVPAPRASSHLVNEPAPNARVFTSTAPSAQQHKGHCCDHDGGGEVTASGAIAPKKPGGHGHSHGKGGHGHSHGGANGGGGGGGAGGGGGGFNKKQIQMMFMASGGFAVFMVLFTLWAMPDDTLYRGVFFAPRGSGGLEHYRILLAAGSSDSKRIESVADMIDERRFGADSILLLDGDVARAKAWADVMTGTVLTVRSPPVLRPAGVDGKGALSMKVESSEGAVTCGATEETIVGVLREGSERDTGVAQLRKCKPILIAHTACTTPVVQKDTDKDSHTTTICPGSLEAGDFAVVDICRQIHSPEWRICNFALYNLAEA